jgi:polyhydroxyalkanoate synthesis regulator phasin
MDNNVIADAIRDSFGRVVYTHKTFEKQLEIQYCTLTWYRWIRFIVVAITATGAISQIFTDADFVKRATAGFAVLSLFLTLYGLGLKPEEIVSELQRTARDLWYVREKYFHLISDLKSGNISIENARQKRDELTEKLNEIHHDAPQTSSRAYKKAQEALKLKEELTFSDDEIDSFLPEGLKKSTG